MMNKSSRRLKNVNKHEHGEHLVSRKHPKKHNEHGHYDHLTLSRKKKKMITTMNTMNT